MRILIADDDAVTRKLLSATLRQLGHEPDVAEDGEEAWGRFDRDPARVVISDWRMPGCDGLELCRRVRMRAHTRYTYFILLTGLRAGAENLRLAASAGVDDFLSKPVDMDRIWARLHTAERILSLTTQVGQLNELLPICMDCHKVRDDHDYWQRLEIYLREQTGTVLSHSLCPACFNSRTRAMSATAPLSAGLNALPPAG